MNITGYFNDAKVVKIDTQRDIYINHMKGLMVKKIIDMDEFKIMSSYKGSIIHFDKYKNILDKIDDVEVVKICHELFNDIHTYFKDKKFDIGDDEFVLNEQQNIAVSLMMDMLCDHGVNIFGLYGYAGTGKTTIIANYVQKLLFTDFIGSVAFAAPTNKAVNVIKSKFIYKLDVLVYNKLGYVINNFDDVLYELEKKVW